MPEQLPTAELPRLFDLLHGEGYSVVGPTLRDGAIVYDTLRTADDLPRGWTDEQAPGRYRVRRRQDDAVFGYAVGPHSWKRYLMPPRERLVQIRKSSEGPVWSEAVDESKPLAFLGVRGCELAAIDIQDQVFTEGPYVDARYGARRKRNLVIAVDCSEAGDLCFCDSMGTGPRAEGAYDLRLTELGDSLLVDAGSERGRALLEHLPTQRAEPEAVESAREALDRCRESMGRQLDMADLPARLMGNLDHERWTDIAERCLACGNCTSSCPTCFCFNIVDGSDLSGSEASRDRVQDSCFNLDHSSIHGAQFRPDTRGRYQQWMTHKLATWTSQFGTSGCVGCGRCIAWCPVGIDLVEELQIIASGAGEPWPLPEPREYETGSHDGQLPIPVRVLDVEPESGDVATLHIEAPEGYSYREGQFNMLSLPGVGDVPISISGGQDGRIEHTIRSVGAATKALYELRAGSVLGLRGPFGSSWPLEESVGRPVVIIAGGIGLAPLRGTVRALAHRKEDFPHVRLLYGTRTPEDILYDRELLGWIQSSHMRVHVTVDRGDATWTGNIGVVTKLMRRKHLPDDGVYLLCGPEVMMRYALRELFHKGVPKQNIYLSMERNMKCAAGMCGRCQYGPFFVCKDGPVFRYDQISDIFDKPGF